MEPWRLWSSCWTAGLLREDQKKKGKIERNKNKFCYLLNIIGIIYGPWDSGGPGQVPLLPWLRAGPDGRTKITEKKNPKQKTEKKTLKPNNGRTNKKLNKKKIQTKTQTQKSRTKITRKNPKTQKWKRK